jgi:hypothetical protein
MSLLLVCASAFSQDANQLRAEDARLNSLYQQRLTQLHTESAALADFRRQERNWIRQRDQMCGKDIVCLTKATKERADLLEGQVSRGKASTKLVNPIPQVLWGKWIVRRVLPSQTISCWDQKQTEAMIGTEIEYGANNLPPGTYRITVESVGFDRAIAENLHLETAGKTTFDFVLKAGNVSESISVDASGMQVNTTDASVSTVVDHKFVENMPLNGRSFQALLSAVPGVTIVPSTGPGASGEITVNGQRTEANYFTVDGVSANNGSNPTVSGIAAGYAGNTPGQSTLGTTHTMVTLEALNEFRALTSSYSAEYGRSAGGQFSFTTRSGTIDWHGNVYDYIRNDALGANQWFNGYINRTPLKKPAERQNDFGATFSGPIRIPHLYNGRDRSFSSYRKIWSMPSLTAPTRSLHRPRR